MILLFLLCLWCSMIKKICNSSSYLSFYLAPWHVLKYCFLEFFIHWYTLCLPYNSAEINHCSNKYCAKRVSLIKVVFSQLNATFIFRLPNSSYCKSCAEREKERERKQITDVSFVQSPAFLWNSYVQQMRVLCHQEKYFFAWVFQFYNEFF